MKSEPKKIKLHELNIFKNHEIGKFSFDKDFNLKNTQKINIQL